VRCSRPASTSTCSKASTRNRRRHSTGRLLTLAHALEDLPLPTLSVAHGLCLTAGLELSLACDLLWAAEGVQFGLVEKVVGITPLMGGTQRMAERAGTARAREFVMTGRLYDAQTLHQWGVVNRVLAPEDLLEKRAGSPPTSRPGRRSRTPPRKRWCARRPITAPAARMSAPRS
jgi:enoyl-CoA hydratase/carnithine racemase